jgi:hypothetical protein
MEANNILLQKKIDAVSDTVTIILLSYFTMHTLYYGNFQQKQNFEGINK